MDRQQELWERLAQRPNAVRFSEVRQLLELSGWELHRVRGSHHIFTSGASRLVVPLRRPHILPVYVREVLERTRRE